MTASHLDLLQMNESKTFSIIDTSRQETEFQALLLAHYRQVAGLYLPLLSILQSAAHHVLMLFPYPPLLAEPLPPPSLSATHLLTYDQYLCLPIPLSSSVSL